MMLEALSRLFGRLAPSASSFAAGESFTETRARDFIYAVLAACLAVLIRSLLDPLLGTDHAFVLGLTAVVFIAWQGGFGPALATLVLSMAGIIYFFVEPRWSFGVVAGSDQVSAGAFFACGVVVAALGEAQRTSRSRLVSTLMRLRAANEGLTLAQESTAHAMARLRESEERHRALTEVSPQIVFTADAAGGRTYFNRYWYELTGFTEQQSVGMGWIAAIRPADRERVASAWREAIADGTNFEIEIPYLRAADGAVRWHLSRSHPVRGEDGAVVRWIGAANDIDARKRAEEELRRSEARFRLLTESIPQIVWNADAAGQLTYLNCRWLDRVGQPLEEARGEGWLAAVHPEDAESVRAAWRHAVTQGGDEFRQELRLRSRIDGDYRWHLAVAAPLRRADASVDQWIGSMADIEDQKRHAEQLELRVRERTQAYVDANLALQEEVEERLRSEGRERAAAEELRRSNLELEQFAYVASHDLQEPLRKIQAFGDRLRKRNRDQLDAQGQDWLDRMLASSARMQRLISDLLAYSRVTTKGQPPRPVDLGAVLADVLSDLEERVRETGASVKKGPMPTLRADPSQMRQLLQNLVGNALKFRKPGSAPQVEVRAEPAELRPAGAERPSVPACRIVVADDGIGFDERYLDRIFEMFQRLHGRDEYDGTGVGLAICRKIAERHGGTISAQSRPNEGAVFSVVLPFEPPLESESARALDLEASRHDPDGGR